MYIEHHIKQVGKVLTCTDDSGKITINKYDNKTSRIIFDLDGTIPGKLYFALLNPKTNKYFLTPIVNNEIEITSSISVYPGIWSAIIIGADVDYEIIDNNIDQTKLTYVSDELKRIVVRDNFLNELNIEEAQSPENLFDFLSEAQGYVVLSKRYAVGDEKIEGSDVDNAKYYMDETKKLFADFEPTVKGAVKEIVGNQIDELTEQIDTTRESLETQISGFSDLISEVAENLDNTDLAVYELGTDIKNVKDDVLLLQSQLEQTNKDVSDNALLTDKIEGDLDKIETVIEAISDRVDDIDNDKADSIINSVGGDTIVINDASDCSFSNIRVFGKSEQFTTTGAQLLDTTGFRFSHLDNGVITISMDTTDCYLKGSYSTEEPIMNIPTGDYTISCSDKNIQVSIYVSSTGTLTSIDSVTVPTRHLSSDMILYGVRIRSVDGTSLKGKSFTIMLNKGSTALPWEPYTNCMSSPNPDFPQEIENSGDDGAVEVGVYSANLLDLRKFNKNVSTESGVTFTVVNDEYITVVGTSSAYPQIYQYIRDLPNGVYVLSGSNYSNPLLLRARLRLKGKEKFTDYGQGTPFEVTEDTESVQIMIQVDNGWIVDATIKPMLNKGRIPLPYEPYKELQTLTIQTPNGLRGIKVTDASIATYTDADGNMWCCDEVDFERGVYVQRVERVSITREKYRRHDLYDSYNKFSFDTGILYDTDNYKRRNLSAMSNKFIKTSKDVIGGDVIGNFGVSTVGDNGWLGFLRATFVVDKSITTLDDFMNYVGDDCFILAPLKTSVEVPLSEEELEQYKSLHTNYPNTTIISEAHLEVKYGADTKNYIDNKFTELQTAIVSRISSLETNML